MNYSKCFDDVFSRFAILKFRFISSRAATAQTVEAEKYFDELFLFTSYFAVFAGAFKRQFRTKAKCR